ncbi:MAG: FAD-dependent oxidoreductase, partial [Phycisphaerales bacterium]
EPRCVVSALVVAAGGERAAIVHGEAGLTTEGATVRHADGEISVRARRVVLSAGAGNAALIERAGLAGEVKMQRRSLHMVMVRGTVLPAIYGHCVAGALTDKPRVTITSQRQANGTIVWYVGGLIAEGDGVARSHHEQAAFAKRELAACVPWVDLTGVGMQWATLRIDRAEGLMPDGSRPDEPVVRSAADGRVVCVWPTKLAFAPLVAERLCAQFEHEGVRDTGNSGVLSREPAWPMPPVAPLPWDAEGVAWD